MIKSVALLLSSLGTDCLVVEVIVITLRIRDRYERRHTFLFSPFAQTQTQHHFTPEYTQPVTLGDRLRQTNGLQLQRRWLQHV